MAEANNRTEMATGRAMSAARASIAGVLVLGLPADRLQLRLILP